MLNINQNQKTKISSPMFGTNLILGKGVAERLSTNPYEQKEIDEFKDYLAKDGKDWNAELTYDTFEPKKVSLDETEKLIKKYAANYDYDAREKAEKNIAQMQDSQTAADFIEKMTNDADSKVGADSVHLAGKIKDSKVAVALINKLVQNPNSEIKTGAVCALAEMSDQQKAEEQALRFINSKDPVIRRSASKVLCKIQEPEHVDAFIEKFHKDADPSIREHVLFAIGDLEDEKYTKNAKLYDELIEKGVKDPEKDVRRAAYSVIGKLTDSKKAVALIEEVLAGDEDGWQRARAAESAGEIKDSQLAKSLILKLLVHPDSEIRGNAASGIRNIKDEKVQNELIDKILESKEAKVKRELTWVINKIKDNNKAIEIAEKLLQDPDADVRGSMAWHLGYVTDAKVQESLIEKHINDKDFDIRKEIIHAIERLVADNPEKAAELAKILAKDEDKSIQKLANKTLERIKEQETEDHYHLKLSDGDKVIGERNITDNFSDFDTFKKAYTSVFDKNA